MSDSYRNAAPRSLLCIKFPCYWESPFPGNRDVDHFGASSFHARQGRTDDSCSLLIVRLRPEMLHQHSESSAPKGWQTTVVSFASDLPFLDAWGEGYQLGPVVFAWTLPKRRGVKSMTTMITGVELDELLTGGEVGTVDEARATTARIYLRARELRNTNQ